MNKIKYEVVGNFRLFMGRKHQNRKKEKKSILRPKRHVIVYIKEEILTRYGCKQYHLTFDV